MNDPVPEPDGPILKGIFPDIHSLPPIPGFPLMINSAQIDGPL